MIIEGNQKELDAMKEFHKGNRQEGLRLQEEFAAEFRACAELYASSAQQEDQTAV